MIDITFSYEVLSVDYEARCMEVLYTSEGRKPIHVGVRIPYENEKLEDVITSFCPTEYWESQEKTIQTIQQGAKGILCLNNSSGEVQHTQQTKDFISVDFLDGVAGSIPTEEV